MRQINAGILTGLLAAPEHAGQFSLFLGAGCSVGAGVPAAREITQTAERHLFEARNQREASSQAEVDDWLKSENVLQDPDTAYSDVLELIRPTPRLRRAYLEQFLTDRVPSPAHWALAKLVQSGVFHNLYTTNFDQLIEQSVGQLTSLRVVSYEEQVTGSGNFERQPTLYKLHGDYLFDRMANTQPELLHLGPLQAAKLQSACSSGGLVVVGYSGRDQSIMEVLAASARGGIPLGLYWLTRSGDELAPMVAALMESGSSCYLSQIESFDSFTASLNGAVTRAHAASRVERTIADLREPFVAHEDGVSAIMGKVEAALLNPESSIVCISGAPGVGKTATARHVLERIGGNFGVQVIVSGKDRVLSSSDIVDQCHLQLRIPRQSDASDAGLHYVLSYFAVTPTLLLLDNLDTVDQSVLDFIASLPSPSRALVTVRDVRIIRSRIPYVWEIEHAGLTRSEMTELVDVWVERDPTLGRKMSGATANDIERLLTISNGWPEAMIIMLSTLSTSLRQVGDLDEREQQGVYDFILGGLYSGLDRQAKTHLIWTGSFPVTVTVEGLMAVSGSSRKVVERSLRLLLGAHLLKELLAGQYTWAHPIVREFVAGKTRRRSDCSGRAQAVEAHLTQWAKDYGGQPKADWSNFVYIDKEFENLKAVMETAFASRRFSVITTIYRNLFSYIVERGYWSFTERWCERMAAADVRRTELPDWLIWWSWIKYYLRRDFISAADLAERALTLVPRENRQRFEAHRRALVAHGELGNLDSVVSHQKAALDICRRAWVADSDEMIDLLNSEGVALVGVGRVTAEPAMFERAVPIFEEAERLAGRRTNPNTREIGIAMLGQARCLGLLGHDTEALELAQRALGYAWRMSWLRGIAELNELVAELATKLGRAALAQSARDVADRMGSQLRAVFTVDPGDGKR
jgi:tetratricopeptide (TPR) repeat protein